MDLKLTIAVADVELSEHDQVDKSDLKIEAKLTTGEILDLKIDNKEGVFNIRNGYGVLR
jgi:hypothetical protein